MNRRNYLKTVAASPLLTTIGTVSADSQDDDPEYPPTYYSVSIPAISIHMIHISIPDGLLSNSRTITVTTENNRRVLDISDDPPNDDGRWTIRNYTIDETNPIESVSVDGLEAREWDVLEVQRAAMFFESTEHEDQGFVIVVCDDRPVSIVIPESEYVCEVDSYTVRRVQTGVPSEVDVWTVRDGERASIPLYPISQTSVARWER